MNKTVRNIIIVALFTVGGGWVGIWLNQITGNTNPPLQSLGALVWLTTPALSGFFLRAFGGDGWKDAGFGLNLRSGWKWYLVAILVYPVAALLTFGMAALLGAVSVDGFSAQGVDAYLSAVGVILIGSLMKNFFEEFVWRGYLTPRLEAAKVSPLLNHLIVGVLWWAWHLPYYYYFLDRTTLENSIGTSIPVFLVLGFLSVISTSILFGELRLISNSVWPVFVLHEVVNGFSLPLIFNGFIKLNGTAGIIFSPTNEGIVTSLLLSLAGWMLYQYRMKRLQVKTTIEQLP
jgi:membrane protease YdiL (CAAX protease family)